MDGKLDEKWVELIEYNGMKMVRIAEPGTQFNENGRPVNSISMTVEQAGRIQGQLNSLFPLTFFDPNRLKDGR